MAERAWETVLVAATAAHAAFQVSVSGLVYPALAEVPPAQWAQAHARHSRRIVPVVTVVYGGVVISLAGTLATRPSTAALAAAVGAAASLGTTALVAAPLHRQLAGGPDAELLRRLLRADWIRTVGAVVALAAALAQLGRASPVASSFSRSSSRES